MKSTILLSLAFTALAACNEADQTLTGVPAAQVAPAPGARGLVVMTRNLNPGMAPESVMAAPADQIPFAAARSWQTLQATNFPERAGALAAEIAAAAPHVVGLQEIALYRVQLPGDAAFGGTEPATTVAFDFLHILLDSLTARGAHYTALAVQRTSEVEVPAIVGISDEGIPAFMDIRYTDGDAILVRSDVAFANVQSGLYQVYIPFEVAGTPIAIRRGWGALDATVGDRTWRIVNTHLEDMSADVQVAEATELLGMVQGETNPVILMGDLNSDAIHTTTPTYGMLRDAGFVDLWSQANPHEPGLTCCTGEMLNDPVPPFVKRIDLILVRGSVVREGRFIGGVQAAVVGDQPTSLTASGLWPSDHAGVVAVLRPAGPANDF